MHTAQEICWQCGVMFQHQCPGSDEYCLGKMVHALDEQKQEGLLTICESCIPKLGPHRPVRMMKAARRSHPLGMPPAHYPFQRRVAIIDTGDDYEAHCSCGFKTQLRPSESDAMMDLEAHRISVAAIATLTEKSSDARAMLEKLKQIKDPDIPRTFRLEDD